MKKIKQLLGYFCWLPLFINRFLGFFTLRSNESLRVLLYHDIPEHQLELFSKQIHFLHKHYQFIDFKTFSKMMAGELPVEGRNLFLTFDDGFLSNKLAVQNILNPLHIKGCFFVLPNFIECQATEIKKFVAARICDSNITEDEISPYLNPMSWDDLEYLLASGHTLGSHTNSHFRLATLKDTALIKSEVIDSGDRLEAKLGVKINCFAYPFGTIESINKTVLFFAASRYRFIFSGIRGENKKNNTIFIYREEISPNYSAKYVRFIVEGGLSPGYYFKRKKLRRMAKIDE